MVAPSFGHTRHQFLLFRISDQIESADLTAIRDARSRGDLFAVVMDGAQAGRTRPEQRDRSFGGADRAGRAIRLWDASNALDDVFDQVLVAFATIKPEGSTERSPFGSSLLTLLMATRPVSTHATCDFLSRLFVFAGWWLCAVGKIGSYLWLDGYGAFMGQKKTRRVLWEIKHITDPAISEIHSFDRFGQLAGQANRHYFA